MPTWNLLADYYEKIPQNELVTIAKVQCTRSEIQNLVLLSNSENCEHHKYFWNVIVLQAKSQSRVTNPNLKQQP